MKRILAAAIIVACVPAAKAQDKGKSEISYGAEYRVRDTWTQNQNGNDQVKPTNSNGIDHRFKLDLGFKASEKFSAMLTLLHNATWGDNGTIGNYSDTDTSTGDGENAGIAVNQAFATWMMAEDLNFKIGRMNFGFGDDSVMAIDDWQATPTSFEGAIGNYEAEFGRFQLFAFKYKEYDFKTDGTVGGSTGSDPEHNAYGIVFDLKSMPEILKMVNAYLIQDIADPVSTAAGAGTVSGTTTTGQQGQNILRYGAAVGLGFSIFDFKLGYNAVTGKNYNYTAGVKDGHTAEQTMMQGEVGVNFAEFMGSRVYVGYHQDSGDKDATDPDDRQYDAYFYDSHAYAGLMDLVGWGNLTAMTVGASLKPSDSTDLGVAYHMFSKTEKAGVSQGALVGGAINTGTAAKEKIGDEIDLWASHKYEGGFATVLRLGYFTPGQALKDGAMTTKKDDAVAQIMVEGKFTF